MENEIDLFEQWDTLPEQVQAVLGRMNAAQELGVWTYENCLYFLYILNQIGYTYEFDLSGEPFNLRKL